MFVGQESRSIIPILPGVVEGKGGKPNARAEQDE